MLAARLLGLWVLALARGAGTAGGLASSGLSVVSFPGSVHGSGVAAWAASGLFSSCACGLRSFCRTIRFEDRLQFGSSCHSPVLRLSFGLCAAFLGGGMLI